MSYRASGRLGLGWAQPSPGESLLDRVHREFDAVGQELELGFDLLEYAGGQVATGLDPVVLEVEEDLRCVEIDRKEKGGRVEVTGCDVQVAEGRVGCYVNCFHGRM